MAPTKKRSSPKKRSPVKKNKNKLAKGFGLGVGFTALVALAYKQGLFDKLSENIKGNTNSINVNLEPKVIISPKQTLTKGKIHEKYMLENISKVLRKPITELKGKGITIAELTELKRNNIEIEDITPFVKILKN